MRPLFLVAAVLVVGAAAACSTSNDPSTPSTASDAGPPDGATIDAALSDAPSNDAPSNDAASNDAPSSDAAPLDPGYCPTGYTLTPFLTPTAMTHTFTKADPVMDPSKSYVAVVDTTVGRIVWTFDPTVAPLASNSFVFLALHHFFDGIAFHRVVPGFVAQGGDPNSLQPKRSTWGLGGPGYTFADELTPPPSYGQYAVAMANSGPNTNGSQFFITLADLPTLAPDYTLFANVTEGSDRLASFAASPDPQGNTPPATPTLMTEVHICEMGNDGG